MSAGIFSRIFSSTFDPVTLDIPNSTQRDIGCAAGSTIKPYWIQAEKLRVIRTKMSAEKPAQVLAEGCF